MPVTQVPRLHRRLPASAGSHRGHSSAPERDAFVLCLDRAPIAVSDQVLPILNLLLIDERDIFFPRK